MAEPVFLHTPYDGRAQPFSIGLRPVDPRDWIKPDARRDMELAQKRRLLNEHHDVVVRERGDTRPAQDELLALIVAHLGLAARDGLDNDRPAEPPIVTAARLVQDDLVLMRKDHDGWRLVAACLCFPSSWSLAEKFDQPMETIHETVPGFAGQMATRINRIFDHLQAEQIVERFNWSIYGDDDLHHPESKSGPRHWQGLGGQVTEHAFVRVERQTLRRLPVSQDIVFTIKVHVDPVAAFRIHPDGRALAAALHDQLAALTDAQLGYKNMQSDRDILIEGLRGIAAS